MSDDTIGGYEELHDIQKNPDKIIGNLGFEDVGILAFFNIFIPFLIFKALGTFNVVLALSLIGVFFMIGIWLVYLNGKIEFLNFVNYYFSIQKGDLFSSELDYFINVKKIEEHVIHFSDGSMGVLFRVTPINFSIKNEAEKKVIINSYQRVLNSLNFDVKINVRTIKLNLDSYLNDLKENFKDDKGNPALKALNYNFLKFWGDYTKDQTIKNRLFYTFVGLSKEEAQVYGSNQEEKLVLKKRELLDKAERVKVRFENIGIKMKLLEKAEITNFYSNYFNSLEEKKEEFGFSLLLPEQVKFEK